MNPIPEIFSIPTVPVSVAAQQLIGPIGPWLVVLPLVPLLFVILSLWFEDRAARARAAVTAPGQYQPTDALTNAVRKDLLRLHNTLATPAAVPRSADRTVSDAA